MEELPSWFMQLLLPVLGFFMVFILKSIRDSILGLKSSLDVTNNNLSRLDRRVAFLEGRLFPGLRDQNQEDDR